MTREEKSAAVGRVLRRTHRFAEALVTLEGDAHGSMVDGVIAFFQGDRAWATREAPKVYSVMATTLDEVAELARGLADDYRALAADAEVRT